MIPLASPLEQYRANRRSIDEAISRVLEGGDYILGREVEAFEEAFAQYCGVKYAVGLNSGTDALVLGLRALGIQRGDHVITVAHTALATVAAIIAAGATPVLVDVDPDTYTLDPLKLEAAIDSRVRAIVAVHLYGQMADLPSIMKIAERFELPVIEDCAQAPGALLNGGRAGSFGKIGCFSFYPTKNLGALGDGGMLVTNESMVAERVTQLRQYGWNHDRVTVEPGFNSRLDSLQAAILMAKLPGLDAGNARRRALAARYSAGFLGLPVTVPLARAGSVHAYHLYVIACDERDALCQSLRRAEVQAAIHYARAAHQHSGYDSEIRIADDGLAVTERLVQRILSLPMYPELTDVQADKIIAVVQSHFGR